MTKPLLRVPGGDTDRTLFSRRDRARVFLFLDENIGKHQSRCPIEMTKIVFSNRFQLDYRANLRIYLFWLYGKIRDEIQCPQNAVLPGAHRARSSPHRHTVAFIVYNVRARARCIIFHIYGIARLLRLYVYYYYKKEKNPQRVV